MQTVIVSVSAIVCAFSFLSTLSIGDDIPETQLHAFCCIMLQFMLVVWGYYDSTTVVAAANQEIQDTRMLTEAGEKQRAAVHAQEMADLQAVMERAQQDHTASV
jgi:hypothetical protein